MKKTIKIFALGLLSAALFSCQDAALPVIDNMIYINSAANSKLGLVDMAEEGATNVNFTVRLAKASTEDVKVAIVVDPQILVDYNAASQTSIKHVDAENIEVPAIAVIPAGSVSSDPITLSIAKFDPKGAQYAVSFKVTSNGDIPVAQASSQYIVQLMKPLKQLVPKFNYRNAMQAAPMNENWNLELMNYTLEWWVKMSSLNINNQAIINSGSGDRGCELYIRFGDLIYSSGWSYDNRFLQIKTMGGQFDTGNPTKTNALEANKWYHFAITYDGTTGDSMLYQNGTHLATLNTGAGRAMWIDRFQMCSSGSQYFPNQAEMCQVRLWKTTRTAGQISKNMRSEVDYTDPDLLMYLPMSEGPGTTVLSDVTGNGHNVAIGSLTSAGGSVDQAVAWTEYAF